MTEIILAEDLPAMLQPGMRVFVAGGVNEPLDLIAALKASPDASSGVTYVQPILPGLNGTDFSSFHASARMQIFMLSAPLQDAYSNGRIEFLPMQLRLVSDYLSRGERFDLALIQLTEGDRIGQFNAGLNVDVLDAVLGNSRCVVAEINAGMPAPPGSRLVSQDQVRYAVQCNRSLVSYPLADPTLEAEMIGQFVADLIEDGDCIQTGIGNIPYAVLNALGEKNDLGLHSGIVDDGVMMLAEKGVLTGVRKSLDTGKMVACMAIGTSSLYQWAAKREDLIIKPVTYTHDHAVLSRLDNFVSINSALQVDCLGQVNSEMINGRQIAGTGGAVDFMRGAAVSRGGRSIIALAATAAAGKVSRIVPLLDGMTAATALRTDVDTVVTEYGVAELRYLSSRDRGDAMIEIAAPEFRDELREQWQKMKKLL
jgi:4-hydroxybutyrate CoA-transferase